MTEPQAGWKQTWACVGVQDGREVSLAVGKRDEALRCYGLLWNCPMLENVHVRDLTELPVGWGVATRTTTGRTE